MSETNRVLVAYASRYGSTGEVASFIRGVLADTHGWDVDVRQVADVTDLTPYRAVVVGSPILGSRWLPGAVEFVEGHRDDLARLPTAFFATGLTMREDTEENRRTMRECLAPVSEMVTPADIGLFGGVLESARLGLTMRVLVRLANRPMGDFRNWEAIHNWGVSLGPLLAGDGIG
jgi:menaquinone-dependent protoporphyrinogen oxidase